jgi:broad specificity phosphatase PhoE
VLARHGQTTANSQNILDTRLPGHPLTEAGHQQAADLAQRLADEPVVAVYASRALRARQTAQPVAARHQRTVQILDGVHEVFCECVVRRFRSGPLPGSAPVIRDGSEVFWPLRVRGVPWL